MSTNLPSNNNQKYVSIGEASKILGVSIDTIRRWEKKGKLSSKRLDGKNRYFSAEDLHNYISNKPLSVSQAAQKLGVSVSTLRRYGKKGLIVPERSDSGERLYKPVLLDKAINEAPFYRNKKSTASTGGGYLERFKITIPVWRYAVVLAAIAIIALASIANHSQREEPQVLGLQDTATGILADIQTFAKKFFFWQAPVQIQHLDEIQLASLETRIIEKIAKEQTITQVVGVADGSVTRIKLADDAVDGSKILNDSVKNADIANGAINSEKIEDNTVTSSDIKLGTIIAEDLADLHFGDGYLLDLSKIDHSDASKQGIILPNVSSASPGSPGSGEGYLAWDTSGNQVLAFDGSAWAQIGGAISLYTGSSDTSTTSSASGFELINSEEITLVRGCEDSELLKWNDTTKTWGCSTDVGAGGAGISTVQENDSDIVTSATQIDFSNDFNVTDNGAGEAGIAIDYANSNILRSDQDEVVTGSWTITASDLSCTNCIGSTEIADLTLGTDTIGNYVATITSGSGISATATGEGSTPTVSLSALTSDWNQTGAFDIILNDSDSQIQILESGATPTFFGILDVGDLTGASSTYTFSGGTGTVFTTANYTTTLDSVYVNIGESPSAGDISGSFSGGLTIDANSVDLGTDTVGNYVATITAGNGISGSSSTEGGTPTIAINLTTSGSTGSTSSNSGLEVSGSGLTLLKGCTDGELLEYTDAGGWACATDDTGGGSGSLDAAYDVGQSITVDAADVLLSLADSTNDYALVLDNATAGEIATAIEITTSVGGGTVLTALDVSDDGITTAVSVGANNIVGTTGDINFTNFDVTGSSGNVDIAGTITAGSGNEVLTLSTGKIDADAITLTTTGGTGGTSSNSGLEVISDGLTLLKGCADNEILKYTDAGGWACSTDSSGGGSGSLDDAYNNGGTITVDSYDVAFNLNNATSDYKFLIDNTTTGDIATAMSITTTGAGATIDTAIDLSDGGITNALKIGSANIVTTATTISSTELDILDSGIALSELTDSGTLTVTTADINGGNIDGTTIGASAAAAGTFTSIVATSVNSGSGTIQTTGSVLGNNIDRTTAGALAIGNTTATSVSICNSAACDTLLLGTNADADTITIGEALDNVSITDAQWSITGPGAATFASVNAGSGTIQTTGSVLGNNIGRTTAGALAIGNTTATSVSICNSTACDTLTLGTNADADTITIGEALDNVSITDAQWSISGTGVASGLSGTNTGFTAGDLSCTNCIGATEITESTIASTGLSDTANIAYLNQTESILSTWTFAVSPIVGNGAGNDYLEFTEEAGNPTCAAGLYAIWANSTDGALKKCQNGTISDLDTGGGGGTLQSAYDASSGNTITTTTGRDVTVTLAELATPTTFEIFNNDTAGITSLEVDNTIASGTLTRGLLIEQSGAGTMTSALEILESAGTITTGITIGNNVGTGISLGTGLTTGISVGSGGITVTSGALAVNSDSITSDGTLTIDANGVVVLGGSGNTFTFSETAGPTYAGTARPTRSTTLSPEYPGAVLTGDGTNNSGTMTSDFCENGVSADIPQTNTAVCNTSGDIHDYYSWTTSQGSAQDYDIWIRWRVPDNFAAWASNPIDVFAKRTDATNNAVTVFVYDTAGALENSGGTQVAGTAWTNTTVEATFAGTYTAGSYMTIRIVMNADTGGDSVQAGEINLDYLSNN